MNQECAKYQDSILALVMKELDKPAEAALKRHIAGCAACHREYIDLTTLESDLAFIGGRVVKGAPEVNFVGAVMATVARGKAANKQPVNVVSLGVARPKWLRIPRWAGVAAAAAAVVLVFWVSGFRITREGGSSQTPPGTGPVASTKAGQQPGAAPHVSNPSVAPIVIPGFQKIRDALNVPFIPGKASEKAKSTEDLSVDDVLNARREALSDPDAMSKIAQWASLTLDKARKVAADPNAPLDAKVGASQSLPPDEAQRVLTAAVAAQPDDANLRFQLASAYVNAKDSSSREKAISELTAAGSLDPSNAISQYKLAALLLEQGDKDGAMAALDQAKTLATVSAYTSDSATSREHALIASGMNSDTAQTLAALTAGTDQYADLMNVGKQLLQYGKQYETAGDTSFAQQLYESVQLMGTQTGAGASYSSEELAALDLQQAAVETISNLTNFVKSPDNMRGLSDATQNITNSLGNFVQFMGNVNSFFAQKPDPGLVQDASNFILHNGDLNLLDYLSGKVQQH